MAGFATLGMIQDLDCMLMEGDYVIRFLEEGHVGHKHCALKHSAGSQVRT